MKGARGRGTLEKEKPPILGMLQRGGEVVVRMPENVQQKTIKPLILATVAPGTTVYTDEYDIYGRLPEWGYGHKTVCHSLSALLDILDLLPHLLNQHLQLHRGFGGLGVGGFRA